MEYQFKGFDYFLQNTSAEFVFPMHMWQDYSGIAEYKKRLSNKDMADKVIEIERAKLYVCFWRELLYYFTNSFIIN